MSDAWIAVPLILALTVPFILKKMWRWVGLIGIIGIYEGLLAVFTGQTLSQEFWGKFSWQMVAILAVFFVALLVHLAWKQIWQKK